MYISRGGAAAARMAHNHEVAGSSPAPATMKKQQIEIRKLASLFFIVTSVKLVPVLLG
jgi:hypothetical protein